MRVPARKWPRLRPLTTSVGLVFGLAACAQTASATTLLVTDCSDGPGSGTLRHTLEAANDNDTVLIQPSTCSTITFSDPAQLTITAKDVYLEGPGADQLTIDGGGNGGHYVRMFAHAGGGIFSIKGVTLTHGKYKGDAFPIGACVYSSGSVELKNSVVTDCTLETPTTAVNDSKGAAIFAKGGVSLDHSVVSNNTISTVGSGRKGLGAGIYVYYGFVGTYATIRNNIVLTSESSGGGLYVKTHEFQAFDSDISNNYAGRGGGIFQAVGGTGAVIEESTISGNSAAENGGFELHATDNLRQVRLVNSTVSGNVASGFQGGGATYVPTKVFNSTIAFNRASSGTFPAGLYSKQAIDMESSIFANNLTGTGAFDVGALSFSGSGNLITATPQSVPLGTSSDCPKLGPLADNGGPTWTHQLLFGSPAIDKGNLNGGTLIVDQRLKTRTVGGGVDIGAYERQAVETRQTDDRMFLGEFESACD